MLAINEIKMNSKTLLSPDGTVRNMVWPLDPLDRLDYCLSGILPTEELHHISFTETFEPLFPKRLTSPVFSRLFTTQYSLIPLLSDLEHDAHTPNTVPVDKTIWICNYD